MLRLLKRQFDSTYPEKSLHILILLAIRIIVAIIIKINNIKTTQTHIIIIIALSTIIIITIIMCESLFQRCEVRSASCRCSPPQRQDVRGPGSEL